MKAIIALTIITLVLLTGCANEEAIEKQEAYKRCTEICAAVVSEDYTTTYICDQECKKKFLEEE